MPNTSRTRHCEKPQATKQPRPAFRPASAFARLLRPLRGLAMTVGGGAVLAPTLALAHPGHGAPVFHSHAWEIGLALVAAIVVAGLIIHFRRTDK